MKLGGRKLQNPNEIDIVIPREREADIVLKGRAIMDMSEFDKLCPEPVPPSRVSPSGQKVYNYKDKGFEAQVKNYANRKTAWIILKTLEVTPDLEWETIDMGDPNTWCNLRTELSESGFTVAEYNIIMHYCFIVNALDESKIEAARERFLQEAQEAIEE
jgi:hypothetical protein